MKKMSGLKKGLLYTLVTAMVASGAAGIGPLMANAASTGTVNADLLNVRSGAATSYARVGTITQGQTVSILETVQGSDGYQWYKIAGSVSGYVRSDFISSVVADTPVTTSSAGTITADWLNVRTGAGTNFSRMGSVAQGTRLTVISVHGDWYKVTCFIDGVIKTGYVHSQYVQMDGESQKEEEISSQVTENTPSAAENESVIAKGKVNVDALNVRSNASMSGNVLGMIRQNDTVEILSQDGSWYKVRCTINGETKTGYVYAEYISKESTTTPAPADPQTPSTPQTPSSSEKSGKVNADALNVRSGAGSQFESIGLIYGGAVVVIKGEEGNWYKVTCVINGSSRDGYVSKDYITIVEESAPPVSTPDTDTKPENKLGRITADGLNFRTGPGTDHSTLGMIYLGTPVTILAKEGDWYKVQCIMNGVMKTGYVYAEFVAIVGAEDEPYTGQVSADFEAQIAAFPESYKNALRRLHEKYPKWNFVAKNTGLDFNTSVDRENSGNRSMIYYSSSTPFSWLSTAAGDYDWATDTYVNKDGSTWKGASKALIAYYMDPRNFLDEQQIFMFETQSYETSQNRSVTAGILGGTFMADGKGYNYNGKYYTYVDTFMEAGKIANASPYFLASRARQEVGGGSSAADGSYGYYNFFNIGAYASASGNAVSNGISYASQTGSWRRPWTSPWLSIVGGAEFLSQSYISVGQNTDYFQKFNVVKQPYYDHQYMGNIQAPCSEGSSRYTTYKNLGVLNSEITFIIPVYENMSASAAAMPATTGNPNGYIKSMSIAGVGFNQTFTYNKMSYTAVTSASSITVSATPVSKYATIESGAGTHNLVPGENKINVVCLAGDGTRTTYTITVYRQ